ncbi:phage tail sheath C-terminal domain-containing protein [Brevibacillus formosus]|uniref:phage tail sheath C-terminal domain-containing protein n=1 Tax=Brevibacillus formosus TaxID=54913 RepID=UPI003F1D269A
MGLPKIDIQFRTLAASAVQRSQRGIVALVLKDDTGTFDTRVYKGIEEIDEKEWSKQCLDYIKLAFKGTPSQIIVERVSTDSQIPLANPYSQALVRLKDKYWNWLSIPQLKDTEASDIATFIASQRMNQKKTFKAVLPNTAADNEGIVNFTTDGIEANGMIYSTAEWCARLAGVFAGLPFTRSATYFVFPEVQAIHKSSENPNADIEAGKLILINDGKKVKIGRAVNSFVSFTPTKSQSFNKIAVVEVLDQIRDDIRAVFEDHYVGKVKNSYINKLLFSTAINAYLETLEKDDALDPEAVNKVGIDIEQTRLYLKSIGQEVDDLPPEEIKRMNTDSHVFIGGSVKPLDAMEDLRFLITL